MSLSKPAFTSNPLWRCFGFYRAMPALFISVTVTLTLINLAQPLSQWLIGLALNDVQLGKAVLLKSTGALDFSRAWHWAAVLIGFVAVRSFIQYLATIFSTYLGQGLLFHLRDLVLTHLQTLDLAYHQAHGAGEIINRATRDSDKIRDAVVGGYRTILELAMVVLGTLALLFYYNPLLASVPAALIALAVLLARSQADKLVDLDRKTDHAYDRVAQDLSEGVHGVRVIKAFALEGVRVGRFRARIADYVSMAGNALAFTAVRLPVPQIIVSLGHAWVLLTGAWLVSKGLLNLGELIAAMMAMMALVFRVEAIGRLVQTLADARASAGRIWELLDARPKVTSGRESIRPGLLRLENVTVLDPRGGAPILNGVDLDIVPGEILVMVGLTGSGKSTLASLLPRLRDPDGGRVLLGGVDLRDLKLEELRKKVQVVYQDNFLFSDSIAGNLRMTAPEASDEDLWNVLARVDAASFVKALPKQLESEVGERGVTLSGGQKQRLCLARALLAEPWVFCADDATSALDAVTERSILKNLGASLKTEMKGAAGESMKPAVLLIASKRSTVHQADRVVLLSNGKIAASGTHAELAAKNAEYRELLGLGE